MKELAVSRQALWKEKESRFFSVDCMFACGSQYSVKLVFLHVLWLQQFSCETGATTLCSKQLENTHCPVHGEQP